MTRYHSLSRAHTRTFTHSHPLNIHTILEYIAAKMNVHQMNVHQMNVHLMNVHLMNVHFSSGHVSHDLGVRVVCHVCVMCVTQHLCDTTPV